MRKVILSMFVTLDGFVEGPNGEFDWFMGKHDRGMARYIDSQLDEMDILLLGRASYEGLFRKFSRSRSSTALRINAMQKLVFADSLKRVEWQNSRLATLRIVEEIFQLKIFPGKHMFLNAGQRMLSAFMEQGLIDEYRIWVHPVVLGEGIQLFGMVHRQMDLHLQFARTFDSGVILLNYVPHDRVSPKRKRGE